MCAQQDVDGRDKPGHDNPASNQFHSFATGFLMDLITFGVQVLNAVQYGMVLFLVASGLTLVFGILGVINLAHGAFYMLGAYLAYWIAAYTGNFVKRSFGSFLGVLGLLLSLILVPIFLFFFLKESPSIGKNWSRYLPMRASPLKSEIVSLLNEINSYLINFFRGQLMVSLIDGVLIGFSLLFIVNLDFALLIGMMVGVLGLIPYAGMMICWVPAVIISVAQFGDWSHPLIVTAIFILANTLEGWLISPKIVGESVGLHPLTVIISVLAWSLVLGGLLGALLAVPLTATMKVLLKRYFWDRPSRMVASEPSPPGQSIS